MQRREFTDSELKLILDIQIPVYKLCKLLNASEPTITKARKKFNVVTIRGARKGILAPIRKKTIECMCQNPLCRKEFTSIPSVPRKYCSHSCQQKTANVAAKGKGSRKIRNPNTPEYKRYVRLVHGISQIVYQMNIDIINPNRHVRTLCGVDGGWQLDHIKPIKECFEKGLTPEEAASVDNLRMLPWRDNLMRQYK